MLKRRNTSANILQVSRVGSIKSETLEERRSAIKLFPPLPLLVMGENSKSLPTKEGLYQYHL